MKHRSTLVLLACIVVVGAFIWMQDTWLARHGSKEFRDHELFSLLPSKLQSIEFRQSNTVVRIALKDGVWMAGHNNSGMARADVALVHGMLHGLNSMGKGTTITKKNLELRGLDESEYGFDAPMVEILAEDNTGDHHWLVGRKAPLGKMVYVKEQNAEEIYTVPDKLLSFIPASPDDLRDRILFPGEAASVRQVEIRGAAGFVQLVKDPQSGWALRQPVSAAADAPEVESLIEKLYRLRIEDFVADNVSDFSIYGLQGESGQISLSGSDGVSRMLMVGDDVPDRKGFVYVRRADDTSVFTTSADVLKLLNQPASRFRNARVVGVAIGDITSISVKRGSEQLQLALDATNGWKITSPVAWNANPYALTAFASAWVNAVITDFNVTNNPATQPEWILEFGSTLSGSTNRIEVFPTLGKKDGLLIRRNGSTECCQINLAEVPAAVIDPLSFKDSRVWVLNKEGISKVSVQRSGRPEQVLERQADGSFAPSGNGAGLTVDAAAVNRLIKQLTQIETPSYIAYNPKDPGIYGLAEPSVELHVGLTATNEIGRVLLIGHETADGYYSMVKGRDVVFYLTKPVVKVLSADLVVPKVQPPAKE